MFEKVALLPLFLFRFSMGVNQEEETRKCSKEHNADHCRRRLLTCLTVQRWADSASGGALSRVSGTGTVSDCGQSCLRRPTDAVVGRAALSLPPLPIRRPAIASAAATPPAASDGAPCTASQVAAPTGVCIVYELISYLFYVSYPGEVMSKKSCFIFQTGLIPHISGGQTPAGDRLTSGPRLASATYNRSAFRNRESFLQKVTVVSIVTIFMLHIFHNLFQHNLQFLQRNLDCKQNLQE